VEKVGAGHVVKNTVEGIMTRIVGKNAKRQEIPMMLIAAQRNRTLHKMTIAGVDIPVTATKDGRRDVH
jgi:hypothetical protein